MTTLTSREFNQDTGGAKRAAQGGPVFITDRGEPAHVLLSIEEYRRLKARGSIVEMLAMPEDAEEIEFEAERMGRVTRPVDLS